MSEELNAEYWQKRWNQQETGWDIGRASTPLTEYIDQLGDKNLKILIPGCGNAWEGSYLIEKGFQNTWLVDLAPAAISSFLKRFPDFPKDQTIVGDFFELSSSFDLILEQTFFCALHPSQRPAYAKKMHELLRPGGRLVGLLFDMDFQKNHPPFGGSKAEYLTYFDSLFEIEQMEPAYNSITPRLGNELFFSLMRRA